MATPSPGPTHTRRSSWRNTLFGAPIRRALKAPDRPIALRNDYITDTKITLVLRPLGNAQAEIAYDISDTDGLPYFTVTGRKFSDRSCREVRDASGLPLFEIHRRWALRKVWAITLPGSDGAGSGGSGSRGSRSRSSFSSFSSSSSSSSPPGYSMSVSPPGSGVIATGSPRGFFGAPAFGNFDLTVLENVGVVSFGGKGKEERMVTLRVERHGNVLASFDVVDGDRKVAEVRESIRHNERLALLPSSKNASHRPVLDVVVMPGVDMSLVVAISVIAADWVFSTG